MKQKMVDMDRMALKPWKSIKRNSHKIHPNRHFPIVSEISRKNIEYLIGMERQSGSMDAISPLYVSRMLNVPLEDVEKCMKEMFV